MCSYVCMYTHTYTYTTHAHVLPQLLLNELLTSPWSCQFLSLLCNILYVLLRNTILFLCWESSYWLMVSPRKRWLILPLCSYTLCTFDSIVHSQLNCVLCRKWSVWYQSFEAWWKLFKWQYKLDISKCSEFPWKKCIYFLLVRDQVLLVKYIVIIVFHLPQSYVFV